MDTGRTLEFVKLAESQEKESTVEKKAAPEIVDKVMSAAETAGKPTATGIAAGTGLGAMMAAIARLNKSDDSDKRLVANPLAMAALGATGGYLAGNAYDNIPGRKTRPTIDAMISLLPWTAALGGAYSLSGDLAKDDVASALAKSKSNAERALSDVIGKTNRDAEEALVKAISDQAAIEKSHFNSQSHHVNDTGIITSEDEFRTRFGRARGKKGKNGVDVVKLDKLVSADRAAWAKAVRTRITSLVTLGRIDEARQLERLFGPAGYVKIIPGNVVNEAQSAVAHGPVAHAQRAYEQALADELHGSSQTLAESAKRTGEKGDGFRKAWKWLTKSEDSPFVRVKALNPFKPVKGGLVGQLRKILTQPGRKSIAPRIAALSMLAGGSALAYKKLKDD